MEGKVLARIAAIAFVAIAITATVIEVTREEAPVPASTTTALQPSVDPLRATLRGCQQPGEAADQHGRDPQSPPVDQLGGVAPARVG